MTRFKPLPRPAVVQPSDPTIRHIALTQGMIAVVDAADYDDLIRFNWHAHRPEKSEPFYPRAEVKIDGRSVKMRMHKYITRGTPGIIDHANGDRMDNRRSNLRSATPSQNTTNKRMQINNTSGFRGVSRSKGKWRARVKLNYKETALGWFATAEEAAKAYDVAAIEVFGEFARLNFPRETRNVK